LPPADAVPDYWPPRRHPWSHHVSDVVERRVAGLTVRIDRLLCVGFGDCIEAAPELWEFDDEGIVMFIEPLPDIDRERLIASCDICPVDALTVHDEDGSQFAP
jgi:ferredoxin